MVKTVKLTVAIDGPAGAGKSTMAKLVGDRYNLMYINTGSMYRAVTLKALEKDLKPEDVQEICSLIDSMEMHFQGERLILNGEDINDYLSMPNIAAKVSSFASIPEVREKLVMQQQAISHKYDVIMDGRDIGTVVLKDAPFKFFVTASSEERALRRHKELMAKGIEVNYQSILQDIKARDYADTNRSTAPLIKAIDAVEIDTSYMTISEAVDAICMHIDKELHKFQ